MQSKRKTNKNWKKIYGILFDFQEKRMLLFRLNKLVNHPAERKLLMNYKLMSHIVDNKTSAEQDAQVRGLPIRNDTHEGSYKNEKSYTHKVIIDFFSSF